MTHLFLFFSIIFAAHIPFGQEMKASVISPVQTLDLSYVQGTNYTRGRLYSEEELIKILQSTPNLDALNLSGQPLTIAVGVLIHDTMPKLLKLIAAGNIRLRSKEGIKVMKIENNFLAGLIQKESPLRSLVLDNSTITDAGLSIIAKGAKQLVEISLVGTDHITDQGLLNFSEQLPELERIYLGPVLILEEGEKNPKVISQSISDALIEKLRAKGINVVITSRTIQKN